MGQKAAQYKNTLIIFSELFSMLENETTDIIYYFLNSLFNITAILVQQIELLTIFSTYTYINDIWIYSPSNWSLFSADNNERKQTDQPEQ